MTVKYVTDQALPDLALEWKDLNGALIDLHTGYTFEVKVTDTKNAVQFTKTTNITGAATTPNLVVSWATSSELSTLTEGEYRIRIKATRTSDSRPRYFYENGKPYVPLLIYASV